ncbi:MAG: hypothetical protein KF718_15490 [Polyangiaceae bacterium]|nr:hypothetical protein [Polyangiaceae bacterium]
MRHRIVIASLCGLMLAGTASASDAGQSFKRAQTAFDAGDYETSLAEARRAYELSKSPNAHLYVSRSLVKLGRFDEAFREMTTTLAEAAAATREDAKYTPTRDAAAAELALLNEKIAKVVIAFAEPPQGVTIKLNGADFPADQVGKPYAVLPGDTLIEVTAPGHAPLRRTVSLAAAQTQTVVLQLEAAPAAAPVAPEPPAPPPRAASASGGNLLAYVSLGVGVAGAATFGIMGMSAKSRHDKLSDECGARCTDPKYQDDIDSGKRSQLIANIGLGVGVVGVGVGTALLLFGSKKSAPEATGLHLGAGPGAASMGYRGVF